MDNNKDDIKSLLEQQVSYQKKIATDLHSLLVLVVVSIVLGVIALFL